MTSQIYAYKFEMFPSKKQQAILWKHSRELDALFDLFIDQRNAKYIENKTKEKKDREYISRYDQQNLIPKLKLDTHKHLKNIPSYAVQHVAKRVDDAYKAFFKRYKDGTGLPKHKNGQKFFGILYPKYESGISIDRNYLITGKYGVINFSKYRKIDGNIKQIYLHRKNDKWYVNITVERETKHDEGHVSAGIDIGLKNLAVVHSKNHLTGETKVEVIKGRRDAKYFDKKIVFLQQKKSKCQKGSRRERFLASKIRGLYGAKVNKIKDFQHKVSLKLSRKYDTIFVEDLEVKKMSEGHYTSLNRAIRNAQLAKFLDYLSYKSHSILRVNPQYTSKICNHCGYVNAELKLSDRFIMCSCGSHYDRDENAARNVYCLGRTVLFYADGEEKERAEVIRKTLCIRDVLREEYLSKDALAFRRG